MTTKTLIISLIAALLSACGPLHYETGRSFTIMQIKSVKKGETTRDDVRQLFGKPDLIGVNDSGLDTWSYLHLKAEIPLKGGRSSEDFQRVTITFDKELVKSISYEMSGQ